jgi:SAM-dependent methyltransferase
MKLYELACPVKFKFARTILRARRIKILDFGCGNHSPTITKRWFPLAEYYGADIQDYNLDDADRAAMERFFKIDPSGGGYDAIPDQAYDFIVLNHVLEHIREQEPVVRALCRKLKPGGLIWIAFPSVRSLSLPSAVGSLHFCDDDSHVRCCDVREVSNWLLDEHVKVLAAGRSRDALRLALGAILLPFAVASKLLTGRMKARGLWYILGFEDRVIGQKRH